MQDTGFRVGQWVVYGDSVGILFRRDEFMRNDRGQIVGLDGQAVDTGDPSAIAAAPRKAHVDFHPVDDKGETVTAGIVPDVVLGMTEGGEIAAAQIGGGRAVYGSATIGLRAARYDEIPASRQAGDNGSGDAHAFHRFGYEGAPKPPLEPEEAPPEQQPE